MLYRFYLHIKSSFVIHHYEIEKVFIDIQSFEMLRTTKFRSAFLIFYSGCGILSVMFDKKSQRLKITRWLVFKNCLMYPLSILFRVLVFIFIRPKKPDSEDNVISITFFATYTLSLFFINNILTSQLCIWLQLLKCKPNQCFLNDLITGHKGNEFKIVNFSGKCLIFFLVFAMVNLFEIVVELLIYIPKGWKISLLVLFAHFEDLIPVVHFSYLGILLLVLEFNLKTFNSILFKIVENKEKSQAKVSFVFRKFLEVHQLFLSFNNSFGTLLTVITVYQITSISIGVR